VAWVAADLTRDAGWAEAAAGADYVLHVASPLPRVLPKDPAALIEPARDGALRVLRAAARAGVRRVVMTSSTAAICYGRGQIDRPFTERDWSDPDGADNSSYTRSKTYAERAAWEFVRTDGGSMELVAVNPGAVLGPILEKDYGTSAEIVLKLLTGAFPGIPDFDFPLVDVRDVADLHVAALRHPAAAGERFLCVSGNMTMREIADVLREHVPSRAAKIPRRRFPNWVVRAASLVDPVTRAVVFELGVRRECDTTQARRVLGFTPRPVAEAVRATADSLIAHGVVT
jgi:dihydroflavonol-4-reductase